MLHCNVYTTIAPDILHQVKKGVWEHLVNWFQDLLRIKFDVRQANRHLDELDRQFTLIPRLKGLKTFPKGITKLVQVTAREYGDIMKVKLFLHSLCQNITSTWNLFIHHCSM